MMFDAYEVYLSKIAGLSNNTCTKYHRTIHKFNAWCVAGGIDIQSIGTEVIKNYIDELPFSPGQKQHYLCVIKRYYQFLIYNGILKTNPAKGIKQPKRLPCQQRHYSIEEMVILIKMIDTSTPIGIRNQTIVLMLYATGMRCSELCHLKLLDVDLINRTLKVFGKNSTERLIPLNELAVEWLERYLQYRPLIIKGKANNPYVFVTNQQNNTPLSRVTVWKIVKRAARKAKLDSRLSTHSLRHAFATHMLYNGANLRVIQQLLGHAQISTTQLYTYLDKAHLKALHQKHHPRA